MIRTYPCARCGVKVNPDDPGARSIVIGIWQLGGGESTIAQVGHDLCVGCFTALGELMAGLAVAAPSHESPSIQGVHVPIFRGRGIFGSTDV